MAQVLYEDKQVTIDRLDNQDIRITYFNSDLHWHGELIVNENGIVYNELGGE